MLRSKLFVALAATGCLATATPSAAVEVNPDGIGQVLLYPYYTVRSSGSGNALNTLITVGNTTDHVKAVRVRFREGMVGYPVADFNVYLNAYDMWTGAVIPNEGGGAQFLSADHSCSVPPAPAPVAFSNYAYIGDPLDVSLDRTREGFVEIVELGDYGLATAATVGSVAEGVRQVGGIPLDCGRAQTDTGAEAKVGTGGLFGRVILINVGDGTEFSYSATALSNFNTTRSLWAAADAPGPTLADADPPLSVVHTPDLGTIRTQWAQPIDAVSAVLMRESISNEFVIDGSIRALTDWVISMPTKYYYVHAGLSPTRLFQAPLLITGACEIVLSEYEGKFIFDREGTTLSTGFNIGLPTPHNALCWASTVVSFNAPVPQQTPLQTLLGTNSSFGRVYSAGPPWNPATVSKSYVYTSFLAGWLTMPLHNAGDLSIVATPPLVTRAHYLVGGPTTVFNPDGTVEIRPQATYYGLPVIGFAAESYTNGTLIVNGQTVLSNYGGLIPHRYTSNVQ